MPTFVTFGLQIHTLTWKRFQIYWEFFKIYLKLIIMQTSVIPKHYLEIPESSATKTSIAVIFGFDFGELGIAQIPPPLTRSPSTPSPCPRKDWHDYIPVKIAIWIQMLTFKSRNIISFSIDVRNLLSRLRMFEKAKPFLFENAWKS